MVSAVVCWIIGAICYLVALDTLRSPRSIYDIISYDIIISSLFINGSIFIVAGIILMKINKSILKILDGSTFVNKSRNVNKIEKEELLDRNLGPDWLCPKCGAINEANLTVCEKCGQRI